jgi:hypothetical protein
MVVEVRELGEIDMVSRARATLDLVTHDDARPAFLAVHLDGHTVLSYGELAGLAGESERVLRHDSKALALRDYPARDVAPRFVARSLPVAGRPGRRARLAAITVHRPGRRLRPLTDHGPAGDRCPAQIRVRHDRAAGRRAPRADR